MIGGKEKNRPGDEQSQIGKAIKQLRAVVGVLDAQKDSAILDEIRRGVVQVRWDMRRAQRQSSPKS